MSPHRRSFLMALAAVLVLAVGAGVLLALRRQREADGVPQDRPGPVLLVAGYGGRVESLRPMASALRAAGRKVVVVELPGDGTGDLREQARRLAAAAATARQSGAPSVDVVGYSAGGVVARVWAEQLGGAAVARRIVTLGSPHHGTAVAQLGALLAPSACPLACRQLVPGSDLLDALAQSPVGRPGGPAWTSVWTAQDETVTPPQSARLAGAVDVEVQQVCPGARVAHGELPRDPLVIGLVKQALGVQRLTTAPRPAQCEAVRALGAAAAR
jgi:pimeloyl-ACP methyl ester carboxylesterase